MSSKKRVRKQTSPKQIKPKRPQKRESYGVKDETTGDFVTALTHGGLVRAARPFHKGVLRTLSERAIAIRKKLPKLDITRTAYDRPTSFSNQNGISNMQYVCTNDFPDALELLLFLVKDDPRPIIAGFPGAYTANAWMRSACRLRDVRVLSILLRNTRTQMSVNALDRRGACTLHTVALTHHNRVHAQLLLHCGADPTTLNSEGKPPSALVQTAHVDVLGLPSTWTKIQLGYRLFQLLDDARKTVLKTRAIPKWLPWCHAQYPRAARKAVRTMQILAYARKKTTDINSDYCFQGAQLHLLPIELQQVLFVWMLSPPWSSLWLYPKIYTGTLLDGHTCNHLLS